MATRIAEQLGTEAEGTRPDRAPGQRNGSGARAPTTEVAAPFAAAEDDDTVAAGCREAPRARFAGMEPTAETRRARCILFLLWAASMMKFCKNLTGPCGAPTYLPTYLPYLWETKKEIMGLVKGYYTN